MIAPQYSCGHANCGFARTRLILLIAGLLLMGSVGFLYKQNRALASEVQSLRQETQDLPALRETRMKFQVLSEQVADVERLRRENEDIHRLRNESRQFREQKEQLAKLAAENQQLRATVLELRQVETENRQLRSQAEQVQTVVAANQQSGQRATCINNLRQLDGAKDQWAIETRKRGEDIVTLKDVAPYLRTFPVCPAGGAYSVTQVMIDPQCTIPGHQLPH